MMPFVIGAGLGMLKSELFDRPKEQRERNLQAATAALSPWTGMKAQPVKEADAMAAALQGGMAAQGAFGGGAGGAAAGPMGMPMAGQPMGAQGADPNDPYGLNSMGLA